MAEIASNNPVLYFFGFIVIMSALVMLSSYLSLYVRTKPAMEKAVARLGRAKGIVGNVAASIIGMLTPFCSCTTVPIFAGLLNAGVETGTAMSFLIASPSIGIASMILLLTLFGYKTAIAYTVASILVAIIGGYIIRMFHVTEPLRRSFVYISEEVGPQTHRQALTASWHMLQHFLPVIILCALIGVVIENYIPTSLLSVLTGHNSVWMIPIVVIIGAAIYADMIVLIPIGFALIEKGVNQGIVLAFMLAAAGISVPSVLLLSKVIRPRLLIYFVCTLILLYTLLGLVFYYI